MLARLKLDDAELININAKKIINMQIVKMLIKFLVNWGTCVHELNAHSYFAFLVSGN